MTEDSVFSPVPIYWYASVESPLSKCEVSKERAASFMTVFAGPGLGFVLETLPAPDELTDRVFYSIPPVPLPYNPHGHGVEAWGALATLKDVIRRLRETSGYRRYAFELGLVELELLGLAHIRLYRAMEAETCQAMTRACAADDARAESDGWMR